MKLGSSLALVICTLSASVAQADATLDYVLSDPDSASVGKRMSIARFFARVDSSDHPKEYLLFQAGKFFPLYHVDAAQGTYALLTAPVKPTLSAANDDAPTTPAQSGDGDKEKGSAEPKTAGTTGGVAPETTAVSDGQDAGSEEQVADTEAQSPDAQTTKAEEQDTAKLASRPKTKTSSRYAASPWTAPSRSS